MAYFRAVEDFFGSDVASLQVTLFIAPLVIAGVAFHVFALFLARRRQWAAVAAIALTTIVFVFAGLTLVPLVTVMLDSDGSVLMIFPVVIIAAFTFAVGQVLYLLTRTLDVVRQLELKSAGSAFAPVMVPPLPAAAIYQQRDARHDPSPPPTPAR